MGSTIRCLDFWYPHHFRNGSEGKRNVWVLIQSADVGMKLLHLILKFCVSCNICELFCKVLKTSFHYCFATETSVTALSQYCAIQRWSQSLISFWKTNSAYRCYQRQDNTVATAELVSPEFDPDRWPWQVSIQWLDWKPKTWVTLQLYSLLTASSSVSHAKPWVRRISCPLMVCGNILPFSCSHTLPKAFPW